MTATNFDKGLWAEEKVWKFFERQGYGLLERRYKTRVGEIDLIVRNDHVLIFVEVKYRKTINQGLFGLRPLQLERISNTAQTFLVTFPWHGDMRFDLVVVTPSQMHHEENIPIDQCVSVKERGSFLF